MDVRRICAFGLVLLLVWHLAIGQSYGKVDEKMSMRVGIFPYDINYAIYLPPDYEVSKRYYPVVYLLHGFRMIKPDGYSLGR